MTQSGVFQFRPAQHEDIADLCNLLYELFTLESDFQPDRQKQAAALRQLIDKMALAPSQPDCFLWVVEKDRQIVGMCTLQVLVSTAEGGEVGLVEDVIIDSAHRHQGLGKQLLNILEEWALQRGLCRLQLLADKQNKIALDFYEKQDWQYMQMSVLRKPLENNAI